MTGYTTVLTQSTGTASAQPTACRILSTTRGYLRTPVPEVHRSRTVRSLMREYERRAVAAEWLASSRGGGPHAIVPRDPRAHLATGCTGGWDVVARGGVDVVLLAVSLSERRGFATFTELRALAPTVPFLFLSNSKDERHGLEALRAGAQDVLLNSELDGERLARALRHAIERNRLHAALLDLALVDELTGLYNRRGFLTLATRD